MGDVQSDGQHVRFLYGTTLGREEIIEQIPFARPERHLPVVLSVTELARFFECIPTRKYRTIFQTMYGAGLRLMEALNLKPDDINSERMAIRVEQGKGHQDRYVTLSPTLLRHLRVLLEKLPTQDGYFRIEMRSTRCTQPRFNDYVRRQLFELASTNE